MTFPLVSLVACSEKLDPSEPNPQECGVVPTVESKTLVGKMCVIDFCSKVAQPSICPTRYHASSHGRVLERIKPGTGYMAAWTDTAKFGGDIDGDGNFDVIEFFKPMDVIQREAIANDVSTRVYITRHLTPGKDYSVSYSSSDGKSQNMTSTTPSAFVDKDGKTVSVGDTFFYKDEKYVIHDFGIRIYTGLVFDTSENSHELDDLYIEVTVNAVKAEEKDKPNFDSWLFFVDSLPD